ncbi:hypothetical protein V6N13_140661 [Hibiscus sabdariffa]
MSSDAFDGQILTEKLSKLNNSQQSIESEAVAMSLQNAPSAQPISTPHQPHFPQPMISFATLETTEEDSKKAAAAAAKLAASTSSAQMLTSLLSSLVAEEAASLNGSLKSSGFTSMFPPEKRPKLEKPMPASDASNSDIGSAAYFGTTQQQPINSMSLAPLNGMQPISQGNQIQTPMVSAPPTPPPPQSPAKPAASQYMQLSGMMVGVMPYGYGTNTLPPPPPLPPHMAMSLVRPAYQPAQPQSQLQQQPTTGHRE